MGLLKTGISRNTCPFVQECQAMELIRQLEECKLKDLESQVQNLECKLREVQQPLDPTQALKKMIESGSRADVLRALMAQPYLKDIPDSVKVLLAQELPALDDKGGKEVLRGLPLKRHTRRALLSSHRWVVHLCSGPSAPYDPVVQWANRNNCEVIHVDVCKPGGKGWDLLSSQGVWVALLWGAAAGRVAAVLSSPPRSTWKLGDTFPGSERGEASSGAIWGADERDEKARRETALFTQGMILWSVASVAKGHGVPFIKELWLPGNGDQAANSLDPFESRAWKQFESWSNVRKVSCSRADSKGVNNGRKCIATNLLWEPEEDFEPVFSGAHDAYRWTPALRNQVVRALEGRRVVPSCEILDEIISKGLRNSREPACVPDDDEEERLIRAFEEESILSPSDEEDPCDVECDQAARAVKQHDLSKWRDHLENGHVPFRRDCQRCVERAGLGIQHRRVRFPQSYTLSIDLFGPLAPKEQGRTEASVSGNPHVKYGLVGAFRVPRSALPGSASNEDPAGVSDLFGIASPGVEQDELIEYEPSMPDPEQLDDFPELWELGDEWDDDEEGLQEQLLSSSVYAVAGSDEPPLEISSQADAQGPRGQERDSTSFEQWCEVVPEDKVELERLVEELSQPTEQVVLRYFVELKSKSGVDVAEAVQKMILSINRYFPVRTVHCDLGTEFLSTKLSQWLAGQAVKLQHSLPADKQANGLAERTVAWVKSRSRTLIGSSGVGVQYWPLAARWATETHNRSLLGLSRLPMFGQDVLHRLKKPRGGLNDLMSRWVLTRYMCPHSAIPDGHVLLTAEGNLVSSKGFRVGTVDPEALAEARPGPIQEEEVEEEEQHEDSSLAIPLRRLRAKSSIRFVAVKDEDFIEQQAYEALRSQDMSDATFRRLVAWCVTGDGYVVDRRGGFSGKAVFGTYCHGGNRGLTRLSHKHPMLTKFLNQYLKARLGEGSGKEPCSWTALMITQAGNVDMHRDFRNECGVLRIA